MKLVTAGGTRLNFVIFLNRGFHHERKMFRLRLTHSFYPTEVADQMAQLIGSAYNNNDNDNIVFVCREFVVI